MFKITTTQPKPYFAEIPYAVWGDVNYESIGDCEFPTDSKWTLLRIYNRETDQIILIEDVNNELIIQATDSQIAVQTALFLIERCDAKFLEGSLNQTEVGSWTYLKAKKNTERVRALFSNKDLKLFDSKLFWESWKWAGASTTDLTWSGRMIMNSINDHDPRGVSLCIDWLEDSPYYKAQKKALIYALKFLTGLTFETAQEWTDWYHGSLGAEPGIKLYPIPDFEDWKRDIEEKMCL